VTTAIKLSKGGIRIKYLFEEILENEEAYHDNFRNPLEYDIQLMRLEVARN
jgi:hypothetical protein